MDTCTSTSNPATNDRDEKGRFRKGNPGGPGNPFARKTAKLRQIALEAVSEEDLRSVIEALKEKAKQGDVAAIKLLLSYTIGQPQPAVDPDTLDQHELQTILNNHSVPEDTVERIIDGTPLELLLKMLRAMLPGLLADKTRTAAETLAESEEDDDEDEPTAEETAEFERFRMQNIPAWLHKLVDEDHAERKDAGSREESAAPHPTRRASAESGEANRELLQALLERMRRHESAQDEPPSPNATNGMANGHEPPSPIG
jgi:hypothetical protein